MIIDNPNGDSYIQVFNVTSIGETTCNITGVMYSRLTRRYYACNTTTPKVPVVGNAISKTKEPESNPLYEVKQDDLMVALDTADIDGNVYLVLADIRSITKLTNGKLSVTAMIQAVSRITGSYNDLANIPVINQDLTASGFTPVANTYYRHTGSTTDTFTQGVIYLYDTAYHKLGESGGTTFNKYTYTQYNYLDTTANKRLKNILQNAKGNILCNSTTEKLTYSSNNYWTEIVKFYINTTSDGTKFVWNTNSFKSSTGAWDEGMIYTYNMTTNTLTSENLTNNDPQARTTVNITYYNDTEIT